MRRRSASPSAATDPKAQPHVYLEFLVGSWGGGPDRDGMDACTGTLVNYANTPAELIEADLPIAVERYAFVPDTRRRRAVGAAACRSSGISGSSSSAGVLQIRSDRREHLAYGLQGGRPGAPSNASIVRADGTEERFPEQVPHRRSGETTCSGSVCRAAAATATRSRASLGGCWPTCARRRSRRRTPRRLTESSLEEARRRGGRSGYASRFGQKLRRKSCGRFKGDRSR